MGFNSEFLKNTIFGNNQQKPCFTDLLFNPAYLTDTVWVSKTDSVPVLSLNGIDNYVTTPITINANLNIEIQFRYNKCNNGVAYQYLFGYYLPDSHLYATVQTSNNLFVFSFGNNRQYTGTGILPTLIDGNIYNVQFIDKKFYINGILLRDYTNASFTDVVDIKLILGGLYSSHRSGVDLIYCKLWDSTQEALYTFDNTSGTVILDKSGNENNAVLSGTLTDCWSKRRVLVNNEDRTYLSNIEKVKAKLISNSIYFNGTTSKATITFNNDVLMYLSNVIDKYSEDGIKLKVWQNGDDVVTGLFEIDIENRTLNLMFDGTNYKEGYQTQFIGQFNNGTEIITFLNFTFSEGLADKTFNAVPDEIKEQFEDVNFCFGICNPNVIMNPDLPIIPSNL